MRLSHRFSLTALLFATAVLSFTSLACHRCAGAESRIANGDMSLGDAVPEGWSPGWHGSGKVELIRDTAVFKSAPASLCLRSIDGPATGTATHPLSSASGAFIISGSTKADGTIKEALLAIQVFSGGKQIGWINLAQLQPSEDWQHFSQAIELPLGAEACQLVLTLTGEGHLWLDDLTTTEKQGTAVTTVAGGAVAATPPFTEAAALPVSIAANDAQLRFVGRFDMTNPAAPICAWSASTVEVRFRGTDLNVKLKESGSDRWQIEVDGMSKACISAKGGEHLYAVTAGLSAGDHIVRLVKATEPIFGLTQIMGFQMNAGGQLLHCPAVSHRIEVIGDSISAGYGNEAHSKEEHFSPLTQNAYFTYGAIAARTLQADYVCVAWSGKKLAHDNTLPELYGRSLPQKAESTWDFSKWTPDVVVINLATNDFNGTIPDESAWTTAYEAFIGRVLKNYPQAEIYCCLGPMMGDWGKGKPLTVLRGYVAKIVADVQQSGDPRIHALEFETQNIGKNGVGSDWHPSVKTHEAMAAQLTDAIRKDLRW